jgi:hypothetical protein
VKAKKHNSPKLQELMNEITPEEMEAKKEAMLRIKTAQQAGEWIKNHNRAKFKSRYNTAKKTGINDPRLKNLELGRGTLETFFSDCERLGIEVILKKVDVILKTEN